MNEGQPAPAPGGEGFRTTAPGFAVAADVALAVVLFGSVLAVGTVHLPVLLVIAALSALAAALQALTGAGPPRDGQIFCLVLAGLTVWTALQLVPLPLGLLSRLAAPNAAAWTDALVLAEGAPPGWARISLDPGATVVEVLKLVTYANVAYAALGFGSRRGARQLALCIFAAGVSVSLIALGHIAIGATRLYGLIAPTSGVARWHLAPLLNPNNLAGYLNLSLLAGLGLMNMRGPPAPRTILVAGAAVIVAALTVAASRGGVLALLFGMLLLVSITEGARRRIQRGTLASRRSILLGFGLMLLVGTGLFLATAAAHVWGEVTDRNLDKLVLARRVVPLVSDHPWFGIGRGAFESVFPAYYIGQNEIVFTHAENFVLQWAAEWGVVVTASACLALLYCLRPRAVELVKRPSAAGLYVGSIVLLIQNLADLALEVPGVTIALVTSLGGILGAAGSGRRRDSSSRRLVALPLAATCAALSATALWGTHSVGQDRADVEAFLRQSPAGERLDRARAAIVDAMHRHPAEPYFPRAGALVAWGSAHGEPLRWIGQSLRRGPESARTHLLLARLLAAMGRQDQALLSLRLAAERDHRIPAVIAQAALGVTQDVARLHKVVPEGAPGAPILVHLAQGLPGEDRVTREHLLRQALTHDAAFPLAHAESGRLLLAMLGEGACGGAGREQCLARVEHHAVALETHGDDLGALTLRTERDLALGVADAAERRLADRCAGLRHRTECLRLRVSAAAATGDRERFNLAASAYTPHACSSAPSCGEALTWLGHVAVQSGHPGLAVGFFQRAAREIPSAEAWLRAASAARNVGDRARAEAALRHAEQVAQITTAERERIAAERAEWR